MNKSTKSTRQVGHTQKKMVVHVPFTEEAWRKIKEVAAAKGMPAATYVRTASLAAAEK